MSKAHLDPAKIVASYLSEAKSRLKPRTYRTYQEVMELYLEWFEDGDLDYEYLVSSIPEFLTRYIDAVADDSLSFRKGAGTVLKKFATFLKQAGFAEPEEVSEVKTMVTRRNKLLSDPVNGLALCLKAEADRWDYQGDKAVTGRFMVGDIGRLSILLEAIESDARGSFPPFWLEVDEEAASLCEIAAQHSDVILTATVAERFGAWSLVSFESVELF